MFKKWVFEIVMKIMNLVYPNGLNSINKLSNCYILFVSFKEFKTICSKEFHWIFIPINYMFMKYLTWCCVVNKTFSNSWQNYYLKCKLISYNIMIIWCLFLSCSLPRLWFFIKYRVWVMCFYQSSKRLTGNFRCFFLLY